MQQCNRRGRTGLGDDSGSGHSQSFGTTRPYSGRGSGCTVRLRPRRLVHRRTAPRAAGPLGDRRTCGQPKGSSGLLSPPRPSGGRRDPRPTPRPNDCHLRGHRASPVREDGVPDPRGVRPRPPGRATSDHLRRSLRRGAVQLPLQPCGLRRADIARPDGSPVAVIRPGASGIARRVLNIA